MAERLRRRLLAGGLAGLLGGVAFSLATHNQGALDEVAGLLGFSSSGVELVFHLVTASLMGVLFGATFHHPSEGYAATVSGGLLYGLLWWVLGPLTLMPLYDARAPTWTVAEAGAAFPSLIGHLLYGAVTGIGFYLLSFFYSKAVRT